RPSQSGPCPSRGRRGGAGRRSRRLSSSFLLGSSSLPGVPAAGAHALRHDQLGVRTPEVEEHHGGTKARRKSHQGRNDRAGGRSQGWRDRPPAAGSGVLLQDRQEGGPEGPRADRGGSSEERRE